MPFLRKTLSQLIDDCLADLGANATLRFSMLRVLGKTQAGLAHGHYGYLDYIAHQAVPFTADGEYLEGWAALKGVIRNPATAASGSVTFLGNVGVTLPAGTTVVRATDGISYTTTQAATVGSNGQVVVPVIAQATPGVAGNTVASTKMVLAQSIAGIGASGSAGNITGGADLEPDELLRARTMQAYQVPGLGGSAADYERWAKQAAGVTRAWCVPNGYGVGTVVVYIMLDAVRAAQGGIAQGSNGGASTEWRTVTASGDQLVAANVIATMQPATALCYVVAPVAKVVSLTVTGVASAVQTSATAAMSNVLLTQGAPGCTIPIASLWGAVNAAVGNNEFSLSISADIVCNVGEIPILGTVGYL